MGAEVTDQNGSTKEPAGSASPSKTSTPNESTPKEDASSPKAAKRRKVNHACIYCRRSHMTCEADRPCSRCVKRGIGHLCHDEPRETGSRKSKGEHGSTSAIEEDMSTKSNDDLSTMSLSMNAQQEHQAAVTTASLNPLSTVSSYSDWRSSGQNQFHDMHTFHPSYMFNAPDITNEYNLLNTFLSTSLIDEAAMFTGDNDQALYTDATGLGSLEATAGSSFLTPALAAQQQALAPPEQQSDRLRRRSSVPPTDKDTATYYFTAADPSGNDNADARIEKLLQAKYDAGLLRPFNYVKGYARLNQYMEKNMQPASRQKILRQLDKFRPKFRERMQSLKDVELVLVEMWFERCLMEYDRVFASMAIPACCWRRTGEIFRGNKEMAELIHVPIENLRDGKLAIHEIIVEDHLVSYWEKFGAIAFDKSQKAMLTSCSLRNPDLKSRDPDILCCFSFTIRRDTHDIPSLIVGNFLPMKAAKK